MIRRFLKSKVNKVNFGLVVLASLALISSGAMARPEGGRHPGGGGARSGGGGGGGHVNRPMGGGAPGGAVGRRSGGPTGGTERGSAGNRPQGGAQTQRGPRHETRGADMGQVRDRADARTDRNNDGRVNQVEMQQHDRVMENNSQGANPSGGPRHETRGADMGQVRDRADARTDRNNDGRVDQVEMQQRDKVIENHQEEMKTKADTNADGTVSRDERKEAIIDQKSQVNRKWEHDADTDGSGSVSADEFKTFKDAHPDFQLGGKGGPGGPPHETRGADMGQVRDKADARVDRNNDGRVDQVEMQRRDEMIKAHQETDDSGTTTTTTP